MPTDEEKYAESVVSERVLGPGEAARMIRAYPDIHGEHVEDLDAIAEGKKVVTLQQHGDGSRSLKVGRATKAKAEEAEGQSAAPEATQTPVNSADPDTGGTATPTVTVPAAEADKGAKGK